ASTYLVVYKAASVPSNAVSTLSLADGTVAASYGQIGVVVATSSNPSFASNAMKDARVAGAAATAGLATHLDDVEASGGADSGSSPAPGTPAPGSDPLSGLQWDMNQIQVPAARAINGGSSSVVVGDIDTGLDYTHPDLAPNVDFADSAS